MVRKETMWKWCALLLFFFEILPKLKIKFNRLNYELKNNLLST